MKRIYPIAFVTSTIVALAAVVALVGYGLNFGVDFTGGSVLRVEFTEGRPELSEVRAVLGASDDSALREATVAPLEDTQMVIRTSDQTHQAHGGILTALQETWPDAGLKERQFDFIGPSIGQELRSKSIQGIVILLIVVAVYIALVFRGMASILSPWAMGLAAMIALLHDIIIALGIFAVIGVTHGVQITAVFVAAALTILGYSLSDTVVIFDRVRENIIRNAREPFADVVHKSVMQTLVRSINTTVTTLVALVAILLFGGETLRWFAFALIVGITLGAYSSIVIASPLLVWFSRENRRR